MLQKLLILWQVIEGARAAYASGLRHVGLRPSGVALDENGRATIQHFGTVRLRPEAEDEAAKYRSPEETRGDAPDELCDVFSFGTIAYELLAGSHPFRSGELEPPP